MLKGLLTEKRKPIQNTLSVMRCRDNSIKTVKLHGTLSFRAHSVHPSLVWLASFPSLPRHPGPGLELLDPPLTALRRLPFCFGLCCLLPETCPGAGGGGYDFHRKFLVCFSFLSLFPCREEEPLTLSSRVFLHVAHPITCTYVNGLVTCPSSPASGAQQVLISFSLSVICSLSFSIPTTVPTSDGHYDNPRRKPGGHPRMGAGIEETAWKQFLLPGCLGLIEQTTLPLGALIFLSVKWDILFCLFWGLLVTDGRESAWTG